MTRAAVVALVLAALAGAARADRPPNRTELMSAIDARLRAIRDGLDGVTMAADAHKIDLAVSGTDEIRDLLTQLDAVKGDDERATEVATHYARYVDQLRAAATHLAELKQIQTEADGVDALCTAATEQLHALITHTANDDAERRAAKLTAAGADLGHRYTDALALLKTIDQQVTAAAAAAHLNLTDSYWLDITTRINAAATGMASYWHDSYQAAVGACGDLALGTRQSELGPVLDQLAVVQHANRSTAAQLVVDYNIWLDNLRVLREQAVAGRDHVRATICGATGFGLVVRAGQAADQLAGELAVRSDAATATAGDLRTRAGDPALRSSAAAKAVADGVRVNLALIGKLAPELAGRANPKLRAQLAAIAARHDAARAKIACTYKDVVLATGDCAVASRPGAACRLDCVKVGHKTCDFIEIVPHNDLANEEGFAHSDVYAQGFHNWYGRDKRGLLSQLPAVRGCENANHSDLDMTNEVVPFEACAGLTAAQLGESLPTVAGDLRASE